MKFFVYIVAKWRKFCYIWCCCIICVDYAILLCINKTIWEELSDYLEGEIENESYGINAV